MRRTKSSVDEEEESVFISMTDIMVGLLFIFIIIIMYFALQSNIDSNELRKVQTKVAEQVKQLERMTSPDLKKQAAEIKRQKEELKKQRAKNKKQRIEQEEELKKQRENFEDEKKTFDEITEQASGDGYSVFELYLMDASKQRDNILRWLEKYLRERDVESILDQENGILRFPEGVLFEAGEYSIVPGSATDKAARILADGLAELLLCSVMSKEGVPYKSYRGCQTKRRRGSNTHLAYIESIFVEGHTADKSDLQSIKGSAPLLKTNLKLSARRATNTFETIMSQQPILSKFFSPPSASSPQKRSPLTVFSSKTSVSEPKVIPIFGVSAYGETRPIEKNTTKEGRTKNRRIDLRILMYEPRNVTAHKALLDAIGVDKEASKRKMNNVHWKKKSIAP